LNYLIVIHQHVRLLPNYQEPLLDLGKYRRLVGNLNYLLVVHPHVPSAVSVVSLFLNCQTRIVGM